MVDVPVDVRIGVNLTSLLLMNYTEVLKMGFSLNWNAHDSSSCKRSSGQCGFQNNQFVCFCHDQAHLKTFDDGTSEGNFLIIIDYFLQIFLMLHLDRTQVNHSEHNFFIVFFFFQEFLFTLAYSVRDHEDFNFNLNSSSYYFGHLIGLNELGMMNDFLDFSSGVENDNLRFLMTNWLVLQISRSFQKRYLENWFSFTYTFYFAQYVPLIFQQFFNFQSHLNSAKSMNVN